MVGQTICPSHQKEGLVRVKCGSLAKIGFPLAVFLPDTTQLLLAPATGRSMSFSSDASAVRKELETIEEIELSGGIVMG